MALRQIRIYGDPVLEKPCREVKEMTPRLRELIGDMLETMYDSQGVGLAAPQVGVLKRVVVMDVGEGLIEMINPEIVKTEGSDIRPEGCLSVPGRRGTVERPEKVWVKFQDRKGRECALEADGLLAVCCCHETDHLDGIVYIDKMIEDVTDQYEDDPEDEE